MSTIKKITSLVLVLVLLIGAVAVSSMNADNVQLNLYFYQLNWPLGFTILAFSSVGVLVGIMVAWLFWTWPANKQKNQWKRAYFQLKQEGEKQAIQPEQADKELVKIP